MSKIKKLYRLCLIIIVTSAANLSMIFYYIKLIQNSDLNNSNNETIDKMLKTPQTVFEKRKTQMQKLEEETTLRFAVIDNVAYWVDRNVLYKGVLDPNGLVDLESAKPVDVFSLTKKQIAEITKAVDTINNL